MSRRNVFAALAVATLVATALVVGVPAATAAPGPITGRQFVLALSTKSSLSSRYVTAYCPSNKRVIGTGGGIIGDGNGRVHLVSVWPGNGYVNVTASEDHEQSHNDSYEADWQAYAWAVCVDPVPDLEFVEARTDGTVETPTTTLKTRPCPDGKQLVGLGAQIQPVNGLYDRVHLDDMYPYLGTAVAATAVQRPGTDWPYTLGVRGICASTRPGWSQVTTPSGPQSGPRARVETTCPGSTVLYASGMRMSDPTRRVVIDDVGPVFFGGSSEVVAFEDRFGTAESWSVTAFSVCGPA